VKSSKLKVPSKKRKQRYLKHEGQEKKLKNTEKAEAKIFKPQIKTD